MFLNANNLLRTLFVAAASAGAATAQHTDYQPHYLVGLLNLPNANIPDIFQGVTSGTYLGQGEYDNWIAHPDVPFNYVPFVGFSDIEPYYDGDGEPALGQFFCLSDNGYGNSKNSGDCLLYTSPSPRDKRQSRMPSSA